MTSESKVSNDSKMNPTPDDLQKHHDTYETGEIYSTGEALSIEEDRRILRKIDLR
jgi:hypothetical protein